MIRHGVTLVGETNIPALVAADASALYARNVLDFLKLVVSKEGTLNVDMADDIPGEVLARQVQRRPILAEWARSRRALRAAIRHQSKDLGYVTAYHGVRLPKYLAKTLVWAPIGAIRPALCGAGPGSRLLSGGTHPRQYRWILKALSQRTGF